MKPDEVLGVLGVLQSQGLKAWLDGGWGVDALLGEVTRPHEDVDLVVELNAVAEVVRCLKTIGFAVVEDHSPVRVVLCSSEDRQADLHLVTFAEDGTGWQVAASPDGTDCPYPPAGFGEGHILDSVVPCITAELQVQHHSGYDPRIRDRQDMMRLAERFSLTLPSPS